MVSRYGSLCSTGRRMPASSSPAAILISCSGLTLFLKQELELRRILAKLRVRSSWKLISRARRSWRFDPRWRAFSTQGEIIRSRGRHDRTGWTQLYGATTVSKCIEPMKALRVPELPSGDWLYEMKFDGCRALAFKTGAGYGSSRATKRCLTTITQS